MRLPAALLLALALAACGKGADKDGANQSAPAAAPTGPPPHTPVMQVTPAPGNAAAWMEPASNADDPKSAPYGNLLDQPVVNASEKH